MQLFTKIVSLHSFKTVGMVVLHTENDLETYFKPIRGAHFSLGFVPTMGALHEGHLSLLKQSLLENQYTVISIFVNPTQFNNADDLSKYPRNLDNDIQKITSVSSEIVVFAPDVSVMYPKETKAEHFDFDGLEHQMEGQFRPGHFDGVGTIVKRLLEMVQPQRAYFGEKDFQQLQIVKKLALKHNIPVTIVGCPIFREANGLAMSSRNERLSEKERNSAAIIYKSLLQAKELFQKKSASKVVTHIQALFQHEKEFQLEYFQIADEQELKPCIRKNKNKKYRAFIAVFVNNIRLIDTVLLN